VPLKNFLLLGKVNTLCSSHILECRAQSAEEVALLCVEASRVPRKWATLASRKSAPIGKRRSAGWMEPE
jgi:hypothetical protein